MRTSILLCVLMLAACSKKADAPKPKTASAAKPAKASPADRLIGAWKVDLAALERSPDLAGMSEEARKKSLEIARKTLANLRFEFDKDGAFSVVFAQSKQAGTFAVTSAEGDTLNLETTQTKAGETTTDKVTARFSGSRLVLTGPDDKPVTLERAR